MQNITLGKNLLRILIVLFLSQNWHGCRFYQVYCFAWICCPGKLWQAYCTRYCVPIHHWSGSRKKNGSEPLKSFCWLTIYTHIISKWKLIWFDNGHFWLYYLINNRCTVKSRHPLTRIRSPRFFQMVSLANEKSNPMLSLFHQSKVKFIKTCHA